MRKPRVRMSEEERQLVQQHVASMIEYNGEARLTWYEVRKNAGIPNGKPTSHWLQDEGFTYDEAVAWISLVAP